MAFPFSFIFTYYQTFLMTLKKKTLLKFPNEFKKYTSLEETKESLLTVT